VIVRVRTDLSEHAVLSVEVGCGRGTNEELRSARVGPRICHRENPCSRVLERCEVLVFEAPLHGAVEVGE
jgi:hypothetical protein